MTSADTNPNRGSAGNMSDDTNNGTIKQKAKDDAREVKHEAGAIAREKAEAGQHRLADEADALSDAIDAAASSLDDQDREGLARYTRELSSNLANAAEQLEGRSVDELANDAKRLARNNSALYMLGSIAVGFGLSRYFKASVDHDHDKASADHDIASSDQDHDKASSDQDHHDDDIYRNGDASSGKPVQRSERDGSITETYSASPGSDSDNGRGMI